MYGGARSLTHLFVANRACRRIILSVNNNKCTTSNSVVPKMSSKQQCSDSARKGAAPLFGKQSSKDILADASGSSAKSPYAAARPQLAAAARGGSNGALLTPLSCRAACAVFKRMLPLVNFRTLMRFYPCVLTQCFSQRNQQLLLIPKHRPSCRRHPHHPPPLQENLPPPSPLPQRPRNLLSRQLQPV